MFRLSVIPLGLPAYCGINFSSQRLKIKKSELHVQTFCDPAGTSRLLRDKLLVPATQNKKA